jgi:polygalacturonase
MKLSFAVTQQKQKNIVNMYFLVVYDAGDDCDIHNVNCGPGHGISIGGLGRDNTKACVSNVTVRDVNMFRTMTGVRIKTWQVSTSLYRYKQILLNRTVITLSQKKRINISSS